MVSIAFVSSFFIDNNKSGGAELNHSRIAMYMAKSGNRVIYFELDSYHGDRIENNCHIIDLSKNFFHFPLKLRYFLISLKLFFKLIKTNPDVVHQRISSPILMITMLYCKIFGKKLIYTVSHLADVTFKYPHPLKNKFYIKIPFYLGLLGTDRIITLAPYLSKLLRKNFDKNSIIIPNGHPVPSKLDFNNKKNLAIFVGRLERWKHPEVFIKLASEKAFKSWQFEIIGGPTDFTNKKWYQDLLRTVTSLQNLTLLGSLPRKETLKKFREASIYVHASSSEGFPNTFIESWMTGTALLVYQFDPDKIISKFQLGLFANGNYEILKNQFSKLQKTKYRHAIVKSAFEYATKHHSLNLMLDAHKSLYSNLK